MDIDSVIFYTNSLSTAINFYKNIVGFELEYHDEEYVSFIFQNQARLGIKKTSNTKEIAGNQTVIIGVKNIQTVFNKFKQKNLQFYQSLV